MLIVTYDLGIISAKSITGQSFADVHLQQKDKVVNFSSSQKRLKVIGRDVYIDPNILWHRLSIVINNTADKESCFSYELSQELTSLFKQGMMRKTQKSQLGYLIKNGTQELVNYPEGSFFVIDGGYLLRKVVWPSNVTYKDICLEYVSYVIRHFGSNAVVVFDGYDNIVQSFMNNVVDLLP